MVMLLFPQDTEQEASVDPESALFFTIRNEPVDTGNSVSEISRYYSKYQNNENGEMTPKKPRQ